MIETLIDMDQDASWPCFSLFGLVENIHKVTGVKSAMKGGQELAKDTIYYRIKVVTPLGKASLLFFGESDIVEREIRLGCTYLFQGTINFRSGQWLTVRSVRQGAKE